MGNTFTHQGKENLKKHKPKDNEKGVKIIEMKEKQINHAVIN